MEGPIPFWGYKEQESNLILPEHDDDDDDDSIAFKTIQLYISWWKNFDNYQDARYVREN